MPLYIVHKNITSLPEATAFYPARAFPPRDCYCDSSEYIGDCYRTALRKACDQRLQTISLPLLGCEEFGFNQKQALRRAARTIRSFLQNNRSDLTVYLCVDAYRDTIALEDNLQLCCIRSKQEEKLLDDSPQALRQELEALKQELEETAFEEAEFNLCLKKNYLESPQHHKPASQKSLDKEICDSAVVADFSLNYSCAKESPFSRRPSLEELLQEPKPTLAGRLAQLIDDRALSNVTVYHRSNLDKRTFSKIFTNKTRTPSKNTILALTIGLRLSPQEAVELLALAGYAFNPGDNLDTVVLYHLENHLYDIDELNIFLFDHDMTVLGMNPEA